MGVDEQTGKIAQFETAWRASVAQGERTPRPAGVPTSLEGICRSLPPAGVAAVRRVVADLMRDIEQAAPPLAVARAGRGQPGGAGVPLSPGDFAYRTLGR